LKSAPAHALLAALNRNDGLGFGRIEPQLQG
jgi:hypothetical protein